VTKLTLHAPWLMLHDSEDFARTSAPAVRVGDSVALARYLDPRLRRLKAHQRFLMTRLWIGRVRAAVEVVTRRAGITAIEIRLRTRN
jgi:hypothetical protein